MARLSKSLGFGLCYGAVVSFMGMVASCGGHGSCILLGVALSPTGLILRALREYPELEMIFFAIPAVYWAVVGMAASGASQIGLRVVFLAMVTAHYAAIPLMFWLDVVEFGDWHDARKAAIVQVPGILFYAVGQVAIWITFVSSLRSNQASV
jgi:hypothetical protein